MGIPEDNAKQILQLQKDITNYESVLSGISEESFNCWITGDYERLSKYKARAEMIRACIEDSQKQLSELQAMTGTGETMQPEDEDQEGSAGPDRKKQ